MGTSPPVIEGEQLHDVRAGELNKLTCVVEQSYPQADIEWTDSRGNSLKDNPSIYVNSKVSEFGKITILCCTKEINYISNVDYSFV